MEDLTMRMTAEEMKTAYPDRCIGITDIEYGDHHSIISADVKYTDKSETDIMLMAANHTGIIPYYTYISEGPTIGGLMV